MQLISVSFALFFFACLLIYRNVQKEINHIPLLFASLAFALLLGIDSFFVLLSVCLLSYVFALIAEKSKNKALFALLTALLLSPLAVFKYLGFALSVFNIEISLISALGISFYSFRAVSYLADVFSGKTNAERNILKIGLYISFFPELLSGPIERKDNFFKNINKEYVFDYDTSAAALRLVLFGIVKKVVIADGLAFYVNSVFDNVKSYKGISLILATLMYAIQIYCDFSAYSDIAEGLGMLLGFTPPKNFKSPYFATNIKNFWNRWHISLSSFFKDYLYIPLGGNRCSRLRYYFNTLAVFLVSGIWHGAGLCFIIWGLLHGFYMIVYDLWKRFKTKYIRITRPSKLKNVLAGLITFSSVCFAWIFFRANNIGDAHYICKNILDLSTPLAISISISDIVRFAISIALLFLYDYMGKEKAPEFRFSTIPQGIRIALYVLLITAVYLYLGGASGEFVYFKF